MLTSCLGDREEVELSDDCSITAFSLGSIRQTHTIKGSKGQDSIYYTSFSGSAFPMYIDQREQLIENRDSLPYNAVVRAILTNCSFDKVLLHRPKDIKGLEPADTAWVTYSTKDSLDFSKPREFLVISSDGTSTRRYTVKVNAHRMNPDATVWDSLGVSASVPELVDCDQRKMVVLNGRLLVYTQQTDGAVNCYERPLQKQGEWKKMALAEAEGLQVASVQEANGMLYASTAKGGIRYSVDGQEWRSRMMGVEGLRLVGVSKDCFYALVDGKLMSSAQSAEAWQEEQLDDEASLLPVQDVSVMSMTQKNGNLRLLLTGKTENGLKGRVWSKMWTGSADAERKACWAYHTENGAIKHIFPVLKQSNMVNYDGGVILLGGEPEDMENGVGQFMSDEALGCIYSSKDFGVTWVSHELMTVAEGMKQVASKARLITATSEDGRYLWVLIDGQLWRGRLNSALFD